MRQQKLFVPDFSIPIREFSCDTAENRGAIFTRTEVVDFILDLSEYTAKRNLHHCHVLEPSFGDGDFLIPIVTRLLTSYQKASSSSSSRFDDLKDAIRAVEINLESINRTTQKIERLLLEYGLRPAESRALIDAWIIHGDFLLTDFPFGFTHVIGNPPYVRQERIPSVLLKEYRERFTTIYDRADLYIPFIEKGLTDLAPNGILGFICSDRWMKNKYGGPLRAMIADAFHIRSYVDMVDTSAFGSRVIAYPAITIIQRKKPGQTRIAGKPEIHPKSLSKLARDILSDKLPKNSEVFETDKITNGQAPWIFQPIDSLALTRRLEKDFPLIESTGCKIGIGVATGADGVFIGPMKSLPVESERKVPLVKTKDIENGSVQWQGLAVINPFEKNGKLVPLSKNPMLAAYFKKHSDKILRRNCAKKNPKGWYRTIDRIHPDLAERPKLLIPDIKGGAHIVYENGRFYPHHNLYYVISDEWNLRALQTVLKSGIANLFVSIYSTRMRGGYYRFQAQYLRRIRLPQWKDVSGDLKKSLIGLAESDNTEECKRVVSELYGLSKKENAALHS